MKVFYTRSIKFCFMVLKTIAKALGYFIAVVLLILLVVFFLGGFTSFDEVSGKLKENGASVENTGQVQTPIFTDKSEYNTIKARQIKLNGENVQIYEYITFIHAEVDANKVSPEGSTIGKTSILWTDNPHFYKKGRIIAVYTGKNTQTTSALEKVFGTQFAGRG